MSSEDTPKKADRCTQPTAQIIAVPVDSCAPLDRPFVSMFGGLGNEGQLGPWLRAGAASAWYDGVVPSDGRALFLSLLTLPVKWPHAMLAAACPLSASLLSQDLPLS